MWNCHLFCRLWPWEAKGFSVICIVWKKTSILFIWRCVCVAQQQLCHGWFIVVVVGSKQKSVSFPATITDQLCIFLLSINTHCRLIHHSLPLPYPGSDTLSLPPPPHPLCLRHPQGKQKTHTPSLQRAAVRGQQHAALLTDCLPVAPCPALGQRLCYYDWLGRFRRAACQQTS